MLGAYSVELLVAGQIDLSPVHLLGVCLRGLPAHASQTVEWLRSDVRVVRISICPDSFHFWSGQRDSVHSLFPLLDCSVFQTDFIPFATNFDVSSSGDNFGVQGLCFLQVTILEGAFGEIGSLDVKSVDSSGVRAVRRVFALHRVRKQLAG